MKLINWAFGFDLKDTQRNLAVYIYQKNGYIPEYATDGSAGVDIRADLGDEINSVIIKPHQMLSIQTGLHMEIPFGYAGFIFSRSGLSSAGVILMNGVAVIDSDYRGAVQVPLINMSDNEVTIKNGERIAQLLLIPVALIECLSVENVNMLTPTVRGNNGFGSTGRN